MASGTSHPVTPVKDQYHHFIPRFILRRFQDPVSVRKTRKERNKEFRKTGQSHEYVLVYDVAARTVDKRLISHVYGTTNLYKDMRAADVNEVETKLSSLEGKAAAVINRLHDSLRSGTFRLDRQQLNDLRKFLFVQHYRNQNLSGSYFDENRPENSPLRDWILHRRHTLGLESSADLWLHTLRYYLDTPHGEILIDAQKGYDKHGRMNIQGIPGGRLDPSVENWNAFAYDTQANLHFLGVWEAADEDFVITDTSFGLWEGLLLGEPHVHRLFVISPRIILVLRNGSLRPDIAQRLMVSLLHESCLMDIELPTATPEYGPESFEVFSTVPSDNGMEWNRHRATPAALKDVFTFKIIKLTPEQTFKVNQVILDNVGETGLITFSSGESMQHVGRKYCAQIGNYKQHLVAPIIPLLESKYSPSTGAGAEALAGAAIVRPHEQIIADAIKSPPTRTWGSDYDRTHTLYTVAMAEKIAPDYFSQELEARYRSPNPEIFLTMMPFGIHYQFCPVCGHSAMDENVIMKACPCYEVFYCSNTCQNDDWKEHKVTCTHHLRKNQGTLSQKLPMENEVLFLLKHHDIDLVEMAVAAMGPDVDLSIETERLAVTFFLAATSPDSELPNPIGGWRADLMQPFCIEKVVVGLVKEQAQRFRLDRDFLEHPIQRQKHLFHGSHAMLNISIVFEPTGKFIMKNVPRVQLSKWEVAQERERKTTNPPRLHFLLHNTNASINYGLMYEHEKQPPIADELSKLHIRGAGDGISMVSPKAQRSISMSTSTNKSTSTIMEPCHVCGTLSTTRCSLCHKVHYCSPEHSQSDWPSHKIDCYVRPPKDAHGGPEVAYEISGILFPETDDAPQMIKVKCLGGHTLGGKWWQTQNLKPYIPDDEKKGRGHVIMDGAEVHGSGYEAEVFFRSGFLHDGSKINRCIQRITKGQMAMPWAGPFIAFRHADITGSLDAVMDEELPALILYFRTGMTGPITALKEAQREALKEAQRAWQSL